MGEAILASTLTAGTIWGVMRRPRNVGPGTVACVGAALALLFRLVHPSDVLQVFGLTWDATVSLLGIVIMAALLEQAGFFRLGALAVAHLAKGRASWLFFGLIGLTAAVSGLYTNDAAILILTPVACEMIAALGWHDKAGLPFLMAVGFVADTFSLPLTTSNLVNIMSADFAHLSFGGYAAAMRWASLASLVVSTCMLWLVFHRALPHSYYTGKLPHPHSAVRDARVIIAGAIILPLEMVALVLIPHGRVPTAAVICAGALLLLGVAWGRPNMDVSLVVRGAPWQVIFFALGMFLVVEGLARAGLASLWAHALVRFAGHPQAAVLAQGVAAGVLASLLNNLPATVFGLLAIGAAHLPSGLSHALVMANVIGNDIGPKLTLTGSLATLLWLGVLKRYGFRVDARAYMLAGLMLTPPVLVAAVIAFVLT